MKKIHTISVMLCCAIIFGVMTGCEKASDRIIYISNTESSKIEIESIGADALLETMSFEFEGTKMNFDKIPYQKFKELGWTFDPKIYGLDNFEVELGCVFDRNIYLIKDGFDYDTFCISITNFNEKPCGIEDTQLCSVEFKAHGNKNYPSVIMNGGVTWGTSEEDIIKAYGKPSESKRNDTEKSSTLYYTENSGSNIYFEVYDNEGVGKIIMESFKP